MEYQEYVRASQEASQLLHSGRLNEAVDAFYKLILSDISDIDKASLCVKLAVVYDRMGKTEDALAWYDKGIVNEQNYFRYDVAERKAHYLSQLGQNTEGAAIYEELVKQPYVSEGDKDRMRQIIKTFLSKTLRGWK